MKRFFALFLTAVLSISSVNSLYADDKGLAEAITAAKSYITVPDERTDISYHINDNENDNKIVSVIWSAENGETEVNLDGDGCLLSYSDYNYDDDRQKGLSLYTSERTQAVAKAFLKTVYGDNVKLLRLDDSSLTRYAHSYDYRLYVNNIRVSNGDVSISVDPDTLAVTDFSGIGKEFFKLKYPTAQGIIDVSKAMRVLYEGEVPTPQYRTYYDYSGKKPKHSAFLAFSVYDTTSAVNAFSGEKTRVYRYSDNGVAKDMSANSSLDVSAESADMENAGYTPEELEAIANASGLIDGKKAESVINDYFPIAKNLSLASSSISKNNATDDYYIRITLKSENASYMANATLNASTGKVNSFYYNGTNQKANNDNKPMAEDKARAIATEYIKKLAPDESKKADKAVLNSYNSATSVYFNRIENGYTCNSEQLKVSLDCDGNVISYNNGFSTDVDFPTPKNVLTEDKAIDALANAFDFGLSYTVDVSYKVELVYSFNKTGLMDSSSQTLLNYKGEAQKETAESGISDVKGHWAEKQITALFNNGYKISDSLFRPDQAITTSELEDLYGSYSFKPYYINNINKSAENNTEEGKTITRYELAEYILEYYGLDKLSNHPNIFTANMYKDEISKEHLPAVAVATEFGILGGDEQDCFNGDKTVTRAEAAVALYTILITN